MGLNVDSITLSEYRLTQDPVRQEVLAKAIARTIFEDGRFSPEEGEALKCFRNGLDEYKRNSLEKALNHYRSDQVKNEFKRRFFSRFAFLNEEALDFYNDEVRHMRMKTPTAIMREDFDPEGRCELEFNFPTSRNAWYAIRSAFEAVYGGEMSSEAYFGILDHMDGNRIELPEWGLQYSHVWLCRDLAFYCPTFDCEGLNAL